MFPGRMNPRQLRTLMRQLGIKIEELEGVKRVIIEMEGRKIIFDSPSVTLMKAQGMETYQIIGPYTVEEEEKGPKFSEEDIKIVMEKAGVSREEAIKALQESEGNPADAIMNLLSKK